VELLDVLLSETGKIVASLQLNGNTWAVANINHVSTTLEWSHQASSNHGKATSVLYDYFSGDCFMGGFMGNTNINTNKFMTFSKVGCEVPATKGLHYWSY